MNPSFQVGRAFLSAPATTGSGVPALPAAARRAAPSNPTSGSRDARPTDTGRAGLAVFALALLLVPCADAQVTSLHWTVGAPIPDGSAVGMANSQVVNDSGLTIGSLRVTLEITGRLGPAFNGDLYATLVHDTGFAVLLNRPGRRAGDPLGYGDDGLSVTFEDGSGAPDIHRYRYELSADDHAPLGGSLTGIWASDGRNADPDAVLDTMKPTLTLDRFAGLDPEGTWTLFVADLEPGNLATLAGWGLEITPVPESVHWAVWLGLASLGWVFRARRAVVS